MSFSNRMADVKDHLVGTFLAAACDICAVRQTYKLRLYDQVRNITEDRLVAVDRGLQQRTRQGRVFRENLSYFCDPDVSREAHHVQPGGEGKVNKGYENDSGDYEPQRSHMDESERQRNSGASYAEGSQVRQPDPCAHGQYRSEAFAKKRNGGGERAQGVLAITNREDGGHRQHPVQG